MSQSAYAVDSGSFNYNVQIEQALNVTVSSNTVSLDLNPESKDFGTEDLSVSVGTNYINGYKLYINSTSTNLTNNVVSSTIPTLASTTSASSFPANYWGYRISSGATGDSSITDENYHEFTSGTLVSSSTTAIDNNTSVLTFAAKANYDKPAGTYANTFTFNATINPVTYSITYADNTGDSTVANLPSFGGDSTNHTQTGMVENGVAPISSTVPTRTGYTFRAWCKGTVSNSGTTCTGTEYSAGSNLDLSTSLGPDTTDTLYAAWNIDSYTVTIANSNTSSNPASSVSIPYGGSATVTVTPSTGYYLSAVSCLSGYTCTGYNTGTSYTGPQTVTVTNNNTTTGGTLSFTGTIATQTIATATYMQDVSSKASGGCPSTLTTGQAYELIDSRDNQTYYVARLADGNCWLLDNLRLGSATLQQSLSTSNTNMSPSVSFTLPSSSSSGFTSFNTAMINTGSVDNSYSYGSGTGKVGVYYNYCAASAGTYCYASGSGTGNASYDVCPKGWRMPTGGSSGEYKALYTAYSSNAANFKNALRTPLSGYFYNSSADYQGIYGTFWSSTYSDGDSVVSLNVASSIVYPANNNIRYLGFSVRCILK